MMTNKEVFKIWAPFNKLWTNWVRPVPFVPINNNMKQFKPLNFNLPYLNQLDTNDKTTAIIVDLPGTESVEIGILLTKYGYRPIPIYNGVIEEKNIRAATINIDISSALIWGASILSNRQIADNAPPAFLTDTNRLQRRVKDTSIFDNSWDVYHQDLPSEEYLLNHGITKILIISNSLSKDLKSIFKEHPKKILSIYLTDGYDTPKCVRKGKIQ